MRATGATQNVMKFMLPLVEKRLQERESGNEKEHVRTSNLPYWKSRGLILRSERHNPVDHGFQEKSFSIWNCSADIIIRFRWSVSNANGYSSYCYPLNQYPNAQIVDLLLALQSLPSSRIPRTFTRRAQEVRWHTFQPCQQWMSTPRLLPERNSTFEPCNNLYVLPVLFPS